MSSNIFLSILVWGNVQHISAILWGRIASTKFGEWQWGTSNAYLSTHLGNINHHFTIVVDILLQNNGNLNFCDASLLKIKLLLYL